LESFIGRGIASVAEQLHTTKQKAQQIQDKIFKGFPAIPRFEEDSRQMAIQKGYVTTLWGRKRRLPNIQLPPYEFDFSKKQVQNFNPLDFDITEEEYIDYEAIDRYTKLLDNAYGRQQKEILKAKARAEGIEIKDNGGFIADAERQCVNARIQRFGSGYVKKSNDISWQ
jgi:DNA polymerase-1